MRSEAPDGYQCPFCQLIGRAEAPQVDREYMVFRDECVAVFVSLHHWGESPGHLLVVPVAHYENLYAVPDELGGAIFAATKRAAIALLGATNRDGTSTRQHNGGAGNQSVWHFHEHVFPRFAGDRLYHASHAELAPARRAELAKAVRARWPTAG